MAIDTKEKRANMLTVGRPWMRGRVPNGDKDVGWRSQLGMFYGGNGLGGGPYGALSISSRMARRMSYGMVHHMGGRSLIESLDNVVTLDARWGVRHVAGVVYQWDDLSGNKNHYLQGTESEKPTTSTLANGRACVLSDGTDDHLEITANMGSIEGIAIAFETASQIASNSSPVRIVVATSTSPLDRMSFGAATSEFDNEIVTVIDDNSPDGINSARGFNIDAAPHVVIANWDGGKYVIRYDGVVQAVSIANIPMILTANDTASIMARSTGQNAIALRISQFYMTNNAWRADEISGIENDLMHYLSI